MENKRLHLEMIQGVITRMAANSFQVKGWSVVLVSALFALSAPDSRINLVYVAYLPAGVFWMLDGYFLWQERLYRDLYNKVRKLTEDEIDFSMNATPFMSERTWANATFSITLNLFHGAIATAIIVVMLVEICT